MQPCGGFAVGLFRAPDRDTHRNLELASGVIPKKNEDNPVSGYFNKM